jgi:hypothetical protein
MQKTTYTFNKGFGESPVINVCLVILFSCWKYSWQYLSITGIIRVITKLPNSEQSNKGKVKTHKYINRQNQSTNGKLWKPCNILCKKQHIHLIKVLVRALLLTSVLLFCSHVGNIVDNICRFKWQPETLIRKW